MDVPWTSASAEGSALADQCESRSLIPRIRVDSSRQVATMVGVQLAKTMVVEAWLMEVKTLLGVLRKKIESIGGKSKQTQQEKNQCWLQVLLSREVVAM